MQRKKKIIAISGMPGAGKGVAAEAAKQLGLTVLVLGDVIREETERRGLSPTPENVGNVMLQLRVDEGPAAVARRLLPKVEAVQSATVVVEGVRSLRELEELKSRFDVVTVAIHASPQTRFQRLLSRQERRPEELECIPRTRYARVGCRARPCDCPCGGDRDKRYQYLPAPV